MTLPLTQGSSTKTAYGFLAPLLMLFAVFTIYPLVRSIFLSLQQTFGPATSQFVYGDNYRQLLQDPLFWLAVRNTLQYALGTLLLQIPLSLGLALLLNRPHLKGRLLFRLIYFSPSLIGVGFVAVLFTPLLAKNTGLFNVLLHNMFPGWDIEYGWLTDHVMTALIVVSLWMYVGLYMVYFLAALQNIDQELVDAAGIDGAGAWNKFRHVTLPAIREVGGFVVLLSIIGSFQLFELPYVILNFGGGPENRGLTIVTYLYQSGFENADLGYASAMGWCLTFVLIGVTLAQRKFMGQGEG